MSLLRVVLAFAAALFGFAYLATLRTGDLDDFALGRETRSVFGSVEYDRVHCRNIDTAQDCLEPQRNRGFQQTALWLGNSQLHAINQFESGHLTAPVSLAAALRDEGVDLVTFSQPNANLLEHYVLYEWIAEQQQIDTIILPVVFDDTREMGIRDTLTVVFDDPAFRDRLDLADLGIDEAELEPEVVETEERPQLARDRSEEAINGFLERSTGFNTAQLANRSQISINLFYLRNTVLGIDPTTVRPMIPRGYQMNMGALERLLSSAREREARVILYLAPIRSDISRPYDPGEYDRFTQHLQQLAQSYDAELFDFAELVPGELYGMKDATRFFSGPEYDFMHFREEGHALLADRLAPIITAEAR